MKKKSTKTNTKEDSAVAIIRWYDRPETVRPVEMLERLQREMNRIFSDFSGRRLASLQGAVFPPVNLSEDGENLYVRTELPGMKPEDLEISVEGETLTIRGEKKLAEGGENVSYHRRERESGRFRRIMTLPTRVDPENVSAAFKNGVLKIVLPKAPEVRPKQITVKSE